VLAVSRKGKPEGYPVFEQVEWLNVADAAKAAQSCEHLLSTGPLELAMKFLAPESQDDHTVTPDDTVVTPGSTQGSNDTQKEKMDSGSSPERRSGEN